MHSPDESGNFKFQVMLKIPQILLHWFYKLMCQILNTLQKIILKIYLLCY